MFLRVAHALAVIPVDQVVLRLHARVIVAEVHHLVNLLRVVPAGLLAALLVEGAEVVEDADKEIYMI